MRLRPMLEHEYPAYLEYFIPEYAEEIASNYRLSLDDSRARAKQEMAEYLPEGIHTPGQVLVCLCTEINSTEQHVGYLWYKPDSLLRTVFIYDFHIFGHHQGQDLAKKALSVFEQGLQAQNFTEIKLRVAGDNPRAQHVYQASGFGITGINMSKIIGD